MKIKLHQQNNGWFFFPLAGGRENQFEVESFPQNVNCSTWTALWYAYILTEHALKKYQKNEVNLESALFL